MRAVFLDRDGVINANRNDHVKNWEEFEFLPGALDAMSMLTRHGFPLFVVTNQAIINRQLVSVETLEDIHRRLIQAAQEHGAAITDLRYCPHRPDQQCGCRKPRPGMLTDLARAWSIDLSQSFLIGDALSDIAAGRAVGCETILVQTGRGAEEASRLLASSEQPHHLTNTLLTAAHWVIAQCAPVRGSAVPSWDKAPALL